MSRIAIYPGSFDPITEGHVSIVNRGLAVADQIIVAVARNVSKTALFPLKERIDMVTETFAHNPRVRVDTFDGLLVEYARSRNARIILRGLRAVADFEYEYQMANMNRRLAEGVETVFLMASPDTFYVSSRLVKEVAALGGDITGLVPEPVLSRLPAAPSTDD
ncbi:MAG: pantetheine-phosphate adenylyltransferase [Deltaproteobacteria bacterium]|nr:MAG: pantetheine-phosphate adenylyltransferase [Deltaproteobacteria bacterium]